MIRTLLNSMLLTAVAAMFPGPAAAYEVKPISDAQAAAYKLDPAFYQKGTLVQDILIATSKRVSDVTHLEAAYQFDMIMKNINPEVARRIRERKVLCILVAHDELTSDVPQFKSDLTGRKLDFYNWRQRGFLSSIDGRPTVLFAEEDVMEYEGGMQIESILIHEFGHVIDGAGFNDDQRRRLTETFKEAKRKGLWNDGRAALRFRRVKGDEPVRLLDALVKAFPKESPEFLKRCLDGGDILVNEKPTDAAVKVTGKDKVLIVFGGEKQCYAGKNQAEYFAEGEQTWFDTNRTMDHDHNQIHTRDQLKAYDPGLAKLCEEVLGDSDWRFTSPRLRAGKDHLQGYDPAKAPVVVQADFIETAALDYYDEYWAPYWQRLRDKYPVAGADWVSYPGGKGPGQGKRIVLLAGDEEYRSEDGLPMLGKILSQHHGFACTVLFSVSAEGVIDPNVLTSLSHPEALDTADAIVMLLRFRKWPDEVMKRFDAAIRRGVPVIALRTSTHAFRLPDTSAFREYNSFGKRVLGEQWVSHWGDHKSEATRGVIEAAHADDPVLRGVGAVFGNTDVYEVAPPADATILLRGQVLAGMNPDDGPASHPKKRADGTTQPVNDPMMPVAWTRVVKNPAGTSNKILCTTMGAATDLANEGLRRLVVNGVFWGLGLEVPAKADVTIVGSYDPLFYGSNGFRKNVKPSSHNLTATPPQEPRAATQSQP